MRKGVIVGFILAIVLLVVAGWFFFFNNGGLSEEKILANSTYAMDFCGNSPDNKKDDCYHYVADVLIKKDTKSAVPACVALSQEGEQKDCIQRLAEVENDSIKAVEICNSFKDDKNFREYCYGIVSDNMESVDSSVQTNNSENIGEQTELLMCDGKSGADRNSCYWKIAEGYWKTNISKGIYICNRIEDSADREVCLGGFINTPELVRAHPDLAASVCKSFAFKTRCYSDVAGAVGTSNPKKAAEICQEIGEDIQISDCYGNVWFYKNDNTLKNYDFTISMCNVLNLKKDDCLRRIVAVFIDIDKTKARAACNLMSPSASPGCISDVH